jgi:hypothetical protein
MPKTITIPKKLIADDDLVVVGRRQFEQLTRTNRELATALKAVLEGERVLREGKTRSLRDFLQAEFPEYAENQ